MVKYDYKYLSSKFLFRIISPSLFLFSGRTSVSIKLKFKFCVLEIVLLTKLGLLVGLISTLNVKYPNVVKEMSKILHDYIKTAPKWDGPQIPKK